MNRDLINNARKALHDARASTNLPPREAPPPPREPLNATGSEVAKAQAIISQIVEQLPSGTKNA